MVRYLAFLTAFLPIFALASAGITYHGRLVRPDGFPVAGSAVQFHIQVRTPGSENCLLYQETHTIDLSSTAGTFAITLNGGTASTVNTEPFALDRVFQNRGTFGFTVGKCAIGSSYTPNPTDGRKLVVEFNDGTFGGWEQLPAQSINYVPMSIESMTVGGFGPEGLLRVVDGAGAPLPVPALTQPQHDRLTDLILGTSTLYRPASSNIPGADVGGDIAGNAGGFTGVLAGDVTGTQGTTSVVKLRGRDIDTAAPSDGQVLKWSAGNSRWEPSTDASGIATESDPTVPAWIKDGIDWSEVGSKPTAFAPSAHVHSFADLQNGSDVYLDYRPNNTSCTTGETLKWNNSQNRWECGADLGLTSAVTSLTVNAPIVNSGTATAPVLGVSDATTSAKGVVQLAANGGTTAGTVVQADDSRLSNSRAPNGAAGGDLGGNYPNPGVTKIRGTAVSATAPTAAGQVLRYDGSSQYVAAALGISDVTNLSTQLGNKLDQSQMPSACAANQTLSFISVTGSWSCTNVANLDANAITAGTLATARLGGGTANASTYLRGDGSWAAVPSSADNLGNHTATQNLALGSNWLSGDGGSEGLRVDASGNVGVGTATPSQKLTVAGMIETTSGGLKFPDGSIQTTASVPISTAMKMTPNSSAPSACDASHDGEIALNFQYRICACKNGTGWINTVDGGSCLWNTAFAGSGIDGALSVTSGTFNLNSNTNGNGGRTAADGVAYVSTSNAAAGATSIVVTATPTGIAAGDEVIVVNLQGAAGNYGSVGLYEFKTVASVSGMTIDFTGALTNAYNGTNQKIVVQRVPNYSSASISAGAVLTANAWNGTSGGMIFLRVSGTLTNAGSISAASLGYRAGAAYGGCTLAGYQGESLAGPGTYTTGPNVGAGGTAYSGHGGSYGTAGAGGSAGVTYGVADLSQIFLGSGGAGSTANDCTGWSPLPGGIGGGIVYLVAANLTSTGTISANAQARSSAHPQMAPGGGAGGSIFLKAATVSVGGSCTAVDPSSGSVNRGGNGRIAIAYASSQSQSCSPAANLSTF